MPGHLESTRSAKQSQSQGTDHSLYLGEFPHSTAAQKIFHRQETAKAPRRQESRKVPQGTNIASAWQGKVCRQPAGDPSCKQASSSTQTAGWRARLGSPRAGPVHQCLHTALPSEVSTRLPQIRLFNKGRREFTSHFRRNVRAFHKCLSLGALPQIPSPSVFLGTPMKCWPALRSENVQQVAAKLGGPEHLRHRDGKIHLY